MPFPEPGKVNFSLSTTCRHNGGAEADHSFLTSALDRGEWSSATADCFTHKTEPQYPLGGPQSSLDVLEELKIYCPCQDMNPRQSNP